MERWMAPPSTRASWSGARSMHNASALVCVGHGHHLERQLPNSSRRRSRHHQAARRSARARRRAPHRPLRRRRRGMRVSFAERGPALTPTGAQSPSGHPAIARSLPVFEDSTAKGRIAATPREGRGVHRHRGDHDMTTLIYAGIGSRATPGFVLADMTKMAGWLARTGWHLASGGADGADTAFAEGRACRPPHALPSVAGL